MSGNITRRSFIVTAPALGLVPASLSATPSSADLVETVMSKVVPYSHGYVAVKSDDLRALCEANGVTWGDHWAMRGQA